MSSLDHSNQKNPIPLAKARKPDSSCGQDITRHSDAIAPPFARIIEDACKTQDIEMLRIDQVAQKTGQAISTIWLAVKNGLFPPPVKLSSRSVGWIKAEVNAVLAARLLLSRTKFNVDMFVFVTKLIEAREPSGREKPGPYPHA